MFKRFVLIFFEIGSADLPARTFFMLCLSYQAAQIDFNNSNQSEPKEKVRSALTECPARVVMAGL